MACNIDLPQVHDNVMVTDAVSQLPLSAVRHHCAHQPPSIDRAAPRI
jgi:hypothetical protein